MPDAPYLTTNAAVGGDGEKVALRLRKSLSYIQQMTEGPGKDRYSRYMQLYYAVPDAGAEVYFADFQRRHYERMRLSQQKAGDESGLVNQIFQLEADFNAAVHAGDDNLICRKGSDLINAIGERVAISHRRAEAEQGGENSHRLRRAERV